MAVQREYLSPNEIAEYLGVSPFTIRRYIKLGELRAVKLLGGFRVHRDELQRFLKAHEVNPAEEELEPEEVEHEPTPPQASAPSAPSPQRVEPNKRNGVEKTTRAARPQAAKRTRRTTLKEK
jgi:excisionase family DNA binding protein